MVVIRRVGGLVRAEYGGCLPNPSTNFCGQLGLLSSVFSWLIIKDYVSAAAVVL